GDRKLLFLISSSKTIRSINDPNDRATVVQNSSEGYRYKSSTSTQPNKSGRILAQVDTANPPLLPPPIEFFSGRVYLFEITHSVQVDTSRKVFAVFTLYSSLCYTSPYSASPRTLTPTNIPSK
ncbi:unnamed protein product, partial [Rotaria magnacalcarata]